MPTVGRDAACRALEGSFANLTSTIVHTEQSDDLAFTLGYVAGTSEPPLEGVFLNVWRFTPDGWRLALAVMWR